MRNSGELPSESFLADWGCLLIPLVFMLLVTVLGQCSGTSSQDSSTSRVVAEQPAERREPTAAERELIISEYINTQMADFGWEENDISYTDEDGLVEFIFRHPHSSNEGFFLDNPDAQAGLDTLSEDLNTSVMVLFYTNDGYLVRIYASGDFTRRTGGGHVRVGSRHEFQPPRWTPSRLWSQMDMVVRQADEHAINNRETWLENERAEIKREGAERVDYEISGNRTTITIALEEGYTPDVELDEEEWFDAWQEMAEYYTLLLRTDVEIVWIALDGVTVLSEVFAEKQNYYHRWSSLREYSPDHSSPFPDSAFYRHLYITAPDGQSRIRVSSPEAAENTEKSASNWWYIIANGILLALPAMLILAFAVKKIRTTIKEKAVRCWQKLRSNYDNWTKARQGKPRTQNSKVQSATSAPKESPAEKQAPPKAKQSSQVSQNIVRDNCCSNCNTAIIGGQLYCYKCGEKTS